MSIHIRTIGKGRPLVFFHGWGFDSRIWLSLIPFFEKDFSLFLVDLPGSGHTPPMEFDYFRVRLMQALPYESVVLGWSMGGLYASRLVVEEPQRFSHLINITTSPRFISDTLWPGVEDKVFKNFQINLESDMKKTLEEFVILNTKSKTTVSLPEKMPSKEALQHGLVMLQEWDLRIMMNQISLPVCYMFGRLDPITPLKTMERMSSLYPQFKYILFNKSAHMPFISHTEEFVQEVKAFIQ